MSQDAMKTGRRTTVATVSLVAVVAFIVAAWITKLWVLTAVPIGLLFGFFLEKGDLCGSSAFSEAFMMKDWRKLGGIWAVIAVSMIGFALLDAFDLIQLNPKPLIWANYIVGGLLFGVGIVLAGGCVSGCLFKSGQGNLNSMAGLVGIPLGVCAVAYGPLHGFNAMLKSHVVKAADGGSVTFGSVTGLPYWLLALAIGLVTILAVIFKRRRGNRLATIPNLKDRSLPERLLAGRWKPWQAGVAIGVLACFAYLSSAASGRNYPLGVTHGVMDVQVLLTDYPVSHKWQAKPPVSAGVADVSKPKKNIVWWLVLEVLALVVGSNISARMSGKFNFSPRAPDETVVAFFGGIILGSGAAIAGGCVVGNIMSGVALMSVGNVLFVVTVLLANWATTYFYMMGCQRA